MDMWKSALKFAIQQSTAYLHTYLLFMNKLIEKNLFDVSLYLKNKFRKH